MATEIIINASREETRIALLEDQVVKEIHIDRKRHRSIVGNIYKGSVVRVLPGMQAAFVDVGLERTAFLYVSDVHPSLADYTHLVEGTGEDQVEFEGAPARRRKGRPRKIEALLQEGQEIVVQVTKEPIGTKGARLTTHITLPGRYLVYMPTIDHIGVSRRIQSDRERARLREIVLTRKKPGSGFIVRTASEGVDRETLLSEAEFLELLWQTIQRKRERLSGPGILYSEPDLIFRTVRDLFTMKVDRLVVDHPQEYERIREFVQHYLPDLLPRVHLYQGEETLFEAYGIEMELDRALSKKIWLKSGGYIVIDHTEALTVIDVNTGRFVGRKNLEETITQTNLEAVREIAYQLRLRNIGGILIIDFIDMERPQNRERVFQALQEAMADDRARPNILRISELGLVEMSRKRSRESLHQVLMEPCAYCEGKGYTKSALTVCYELLRKLRKMAPHTKERRIQLTVHPQVASLLSDEEREGLDELEKTYSKRIQVRADPLLHIEEYEIRPLAR